jgi:O-methyltransferase
MSLELLVKRALGRLGYQISQAPAALWAGDDKLAALVEKTSGVTLLDPSRLALLYRCAQQAARIPGEAAEVGVYRGGAARVLCEALQDAGKTIHLFDTFSGMPAVDAGKDRHRAGDFTDTSLEAVKSFLAGCAGTQFHPGLFPDTARGLGSARFSVVHVDVDIYPSVKACAEFFYPRLSPGGLMLFDDYAQPSCPGAKQAVDEFFSGKPERPLPLPSGQCLLVKLP